MSWKSAKQAADELRNDGQAAVWMAWLEQLQRFTAGPCKERGDG